MLDVIPLPFPGDIPRDEEYYWYMFPILEKLVRELPKLLDQIKFPTASYNPSQGRYGRSQAEAKNRLVGRAKCFCRALALHATCFKLHDIALFYDKLFFWCEDYKEAV